MASLAGSEGVRGYVICRGGEGGAELSYMGLRRVVIGVGCVAGGALFDFFFLSWV